MWKPDPEMKAVVRYVWYEWEMFSWASDVMKSTILIGRDPDDWNTGTGGQNEVTDAVIEVTLLHARQLRDFLGRDRAELKGYDKTDIVAGDFFDNPGEWTPHAFPSLAPKKEREHLNRALAHLAYDRADYEAADKEWPFKEIFSEVTAAWVAFLDALHPDRRKWFDEEQDFRPARRGRTRPPI